MAVQGLEQPSANSIGVMLTITDPRAMARLETESGRHTFRRGNAPDITCYVETVSKQASQYEPPEDVGRSGAFRDHRPRRVYDLAGDVLHDFLLNEDLPMSRDVEATIAQATQLYLLKRIWNLIDKWN